MIDFSINFTLPSGRSIRVNEIHNRQYLKILKFCENNDYEGLSELFDVDIIKHKDLDIIDKLYILLYARVLFIGDTITFLNNDKNQVEYSLLQLLERIELGYQDFDTTIHKKGFTLKLGLPTAIYFRSADDIYNSIIRSIEYNNHCIDFTQISIDDQNSVLGCLPKEIFFLLKEYIDRISEHFKGFTLIEEEKDLDIKQYKIDLISNGIMHFLSNIYSGGLANFYMLMYGFINKIHGQGELFFELTPIETKILFNYYNKEIEEKNKELQKQQNNIN